MPAPAALPRPSRLIGRRPFAKNSYRYAASIVSITLRNTRLWVRPDALSRLRALHLARRSAGSDDRHFPRPHARFVPLDVHRRPDWRPDCLHVAGRLAALGVLQDLERRHRFLRFAVGRFPRLRARLPLLFAPPDAWLVAAG